ncbi:MAG: hypothetical protein AAGA42_06780 [Actinomycetota bacterium]
MEMPRTPTRAAPVVDVRRRPRSIRPYDRPGVGVRVAIGITAALGLVAVVALMLSDRAPSALRQMFGSSAERLSRRIDASARLPATDQLPESDFLVHVGLWAAVAVLVGWTLWSWRGLVVGAVTVMTASAFVEVAQGRYSTSRAVETSDLAGNAVGVAIGTVIAATSYLVWSAGVAIGRRFQR